MRAVMTEDAPHFPSVAQVGAQDLDELERVYAQAQAFRTVQ